MTTFTQYVQAELIDPQTNTTVRGTVQRQNSSSVYVKWDGEGGNGNTTRERRPRKRDNHTIDLCGMTIRLLTDEDVAERELAELAERDAAALRRFRAGAAQGSVDHLTNDELCAARRATTDRDELDLITYEVRLRMKLGIKGPKGVVESTSDAQIVRNAFDRLIAEGHYVDGVVDLADLSTEARMVASERGVYFAGPNFTAGVEQIVAEGVLRHVGEHGLMTTQPRPVPATA